MLGNPVFRESGIKLKNFVSRFGIETSPVQQAKFSPILAQLIVTRKCNLECGYCNEYDLTSTPVPKDVLFGRIEKLRQLGTLSLEFSGGEPLLHPDLFEIIEYATKKNFITRMMITNGYLLSEDIIKKLNDVGLTHMQLSVDGVKANSMTVKVLDRLKPKLELLAKFRKFDVTINSVIGASPASEVEQVFDFTDRLGFTPRFLVVHDENGQMKLSREDLDLYHVLKERIYKSSTKKIYLDELLAGKSAYFKCRAGSRYLYIDEFGIVHQCSQTMQEYGKSLTEFSVDDLKKNFYTPHHCADRCTIGCARTNSTLDGWRQQ